MDDKHLRAVTVSEAAQILGVTRQRVLQLVHDGSLRATRFGQQWVIDRSDVERRRESAVTGGHFSPHRAWGLLFLADGWPVSWLDRSSQWQLRQQLRERGLRKLQNRLSRRAHTHYLRAHPGDLERIRNENGVIATGPSARRAANIVASDRLEAYVTTAVLGELLERYRMRPNIEPNVVLREIPDLIGSHLMSKEAPPSAVAIDLLEDDDPRSQEAGQALMARYW